MTLGISGPIFADDTFEFIPILESWELPWSENTHFLKKGDRIIAISDGNEYVPTSNGKKLRMESTIHEFRLTSEMRTYSEVATRNKHFGKWLSEYIPKEYENAVIHSDPDFKNSTYGDSRKTPKGKQIMKLKENDYLFFVASLAPYVKEAYVGRDKNLIRYYQRGNMAKFVIGYFMVQASYVAFKVDDPIPLLYVPFGNSDSVEVDEATMYRIQNNAHTKRKSDEYSIVIGNPSDSALLKRAVRLAENGSPFRPNKIGKEIYGDVGFPRGFKWVYDLNRIQSLLNYCHAGMQD
jgi:hypothetical protein